jgi:hypothetical protein
MGTTITNQNLTGGRSAEWTHLDSTLPSQLFEFKKKLVWVIEGSITEESLWNVNLPNIVL